MDKTDTPRTNARVEWINKDAIYKAPEQKYECLSGYIALLIGDCMELERDLAAATKRIQELEGALTHISNLRKDADDVRGFVDDPYPKALNAAVSIARAALSPKTEGK